MPGDSVAIVFSDVTRPAPNKIMIPVLLEELAEAGIDRRSITLINALGMHRMNTPEELESMLGRDVAQDIRQNAKALLLQQVSLRRDLVHIAFLRAIAKVGDMSVSSRGVAMIVGNDVPRCLEQKRARVVDVLRFLEGNELGEGRLRHLLGFRRASPIPRHHITAKFRPNEAINLTERFRCGSRSFEKTICPSEIFRCRYASHTRTCAESTMERLRQHTLHRASADRNLRAYPSSASARTGPGRSCRTRAPEVRLGRR